MHRPLSLAKQRIDVVFEQVKEVIVAFDTKNRIAAGLRDRDGGISNIGADIDNPMVRMIELFAQDWKKAVIKAMPGLVFREQMFGVEQDCMLADFIRLRGWSSPQQQRICS
jgi:hypothetical protein